MRIAIATDSLDGIATELADELIRRGHDVATGGALADAGNSDWAWCSAQAATAVASGEADQAVVACWTGTGASIAANKIPGIRAALCVDATTAAGARRWNDANVLALSLRSTSAAVLREILDAWFAGQSSTETDDLANIAQLDRLGQGLARPE